MFAHYGRIIYFGKKYCRFKKIIFVPFGLASDLRCRLFARRNELLRENFTFICGEDQPIIDTPARSLLLYNYIAYILHTIA